MRQKVSSFFSQDSKSSGLGTMAGKRWCWYLYEKKITEDSNGLRVEGKSVKKENEVSRVAPQPREVEEQKKGKGKQILRVRMWVLPPAREDRGSSDT